MSRRTDRRGRPARAPTPTGCSACRSTCAAFKAGGINKHPDIKVIEQRPATALLDGDNGMGHLVMRRAAQLAIEKAKQTGVGWVGARMSNHAGPAALYAMMPLAHDMIGLYFAVGSNNHLAADR